MPDRCSTRSSRRRSKPLTTRPGRSSRAADADLVTTRAKATRLATLVKEDSAAVQDFDDAEAAFRVAQATVQQDRAAVEAARINLAFTRVTAPITGRIGISTVTKGALVTANQTDRARHDPAARPDLRRPHAIG